MMKDKQVQRLILWLPSPPALRGRRAGDEGGRALRRTANSVANLPASEAPHPRPLSPKRGEGSQFRFVLRSLTTTNLFVSAGRGVRGSSSDHCDMTNRRNQNSPARDPQRVAFAREQRKRANEFAQHVWQMVRASHMRSLKIRREHPIGPYTVDFVCLAIKFILEVDGKDHFTEAGVRRDRERDEYLRREGYEVFRLEGYQVTQDPFEARKRIEQAVIARQAEREETPSTQANRGQAAPVSCVDTNARREPEKDG